MAEARNLELEAAVIADRSALPVYADWLQAAGDPWGELIALELARKHKAAQVVQKLNRSSFEGKVGVTRWRNGLLRAATIEGRQRPEQLESLLQLRTAFTLERLLVEAPTPKMVAALARLPRTLESMWTDGGRSIGELAHPTLKQLELHEVAARTLGRLGRGSGLPSLRRLKLIQVYSDWQVIQTLLDSPLLQRLEAVSIAVTLNEEHTTKLLANAERLAHIPLVAISPWFGMERQAKRAFGKRLGKFPEAEW
jgi:hypothetical protein